MAAGVDTQASNSTACGKSEDMLSDMFKKDLGVDINPQAMRMFIRIRFERLSTLSHRIHDGKP